jgi:hypothetical protein
MTLIAACGEEGPQPSVVIRTPGDPPVSGEDLGAAQDMAQDVAPDLPPPVICAGVRCEAKQACDEAEQRCFYPCDNTLVCDARGQCGFAQPCPADMYCEQQRCAPLPDVPAPTASDLSQLVETRCDAAPSEVSGSTWRLDFTAPSDVTSYTVVLYSKAGAAFARQIDMPDGSVLQATVDYSFEYMSPRPANSPRAPAGVHADITSYMTIQVPLYASERLKLQQGLHTLHGVGEQPCLYIVSERDDQTTQLLDLNIHIVDAAGMTAAMAARDEDMIRALNTTRQLLEQQGISLGEVRFLDVPPGVVARYAYVRDGAGLDELLAYGQHRPADLSEALAVDLFLTTDVLFDGGALGVAGGKPSPPGLHGQRRTGVIVSLNAFNYVGGAVSAGATIAHEIGHYLGLPHTTELSRKEDPYTDTPRCDALLLQSTCPDASNLMFPILTGDGALLSLSAQQGATLRANGHTK